MASGGIAVIGLREFGRQLKKIDGELPKQLRIALNESANLVVDEARPQFPHLRGRARKSVKAASTRTEARVRMGGGKASHAPWLDFGGRVGRNRSVARTYKKEGRYVYPTYRRLKASGAFERKLSDALTDLARKAGVEVD